MSFSRSHDLTQLPGAAPADQARLRVFCTSITALAVAFGASFLALGVRFDAPGSMTVGAMLFAYGTVCVLGSREARRGNARRAVTWIGYGLLVLLIALSCVMPFAYPTLNVASIILVAGVVPYLAGPRLKALLGTTLVAIVLITINGYRNPMPPAVLPREVEWLVLVGGSGAASFLVFLLLWQFSTRIRDTAIAQHGAEARAHFLSRASRVLGESLDYHATLSKVSHLAVPTIADWCTLSLVEPDGSLRRVAVVHKDPEKQDIARQYETGFPPDQHRISEYHSVLESGRPVLAPQVTDAQLQAAAQDPDHLRILRGPRGTGCIMVPLIARGRVLGAFSLMLSSNERTFSPADLALAKDLAGRAALAIENARLYEAEQRAVRVRDDFLSIAGHELKTPLTAAQVQLQSLKRMTGRGALDAAKLDERLAKTTRHVERLSRLVNELLDVSRLTAGRLELERERFDLAALVRDVAERFAESAENAGTRIVVVDDGAIHGDWDRFRIEQVVTNLISNAVKYGAASAVEIETRRADRLAILKVRDHGIGIDPEHRDRIFGRFERAVSQRHFGGFGLGLWIVRQIVEASGGQIQVDSAPGTGATFTVALPCEPPPPEHIIN